MSETDAAATQSQAKTKQRPWLFRIGVVMVVVGVSLLGYVVWQMFGTNYVSAKKHETIVGQIEQEWAEGGDTIKAAGSEASYVVRIPRFGVSYEVPILEGTTDDVLAAGYGHFDDSAAAGKEGNFALAAHRVTHGEPLRRMEELQVGDEIVVETREATYTYVLDTAGDELTVDFTAGWVVDPLPTNPLGGVEPAQVPGQKLITLTTCAEIFHTDDRLVAFGHLQTTTERE